MEVTPDDRKNRELRPKSLPRPRQQRDYPRTARQTILLMGWGEGKGFWFTTPKRSSPPETREVLEFHSKPASQTATLKNEGPAKTQRVCETHHLLQLQGDSVHNFEKEPRCCSTS